MKRRKIRVKNVRISIISLKPDVVSGVRVIRLVHKLICDFYNPSSSSEPLFWRNHVLKGCIDVPESLRGVSSTLTAEVIYSFRDLTINGEAVPFEKSIRCRNLNEVEYRISCDKIAESKETYNVSYIEEALYQFNDNYEDEIRSPVHRILMIIEKPEYLRLSINSFGENVTLNVLENSSTLHCVEIRGKLISGNGFSIHWWPDYTSIAQENPERVQAFLNEQLEELRQILLETANQLKDKDPEKAKEAKRWRKHFERGISITADFTKIVAFLTGIASLPALVNSETAKKVIEFLSKILQL